MAEAIVAPPTHTSAMKAPGPSLKLEGSSDAAEVEIFVRSDKDPNQAFSGTFSLSAMTVTCECSDCKRTKDWKLAAFEKHAGLKANSWQGSLMVSPGENLGEWVAAQESVKSKGITPKQRWQQLSKGLPQGWAAETSKKFGSSYTGACGECGKTASIESKTAMEKFLANHKHNAHWANTKADHFTWSTASPSAPPNDTSTTEPSSKAGPHKDKKLPESGKDTAKNGKGAPKTCKDAPKGSKDIAKSVHKAEKPAAADPSSPGAEPSCKQCGTTTTPQWRNGKTMCNACYLRERKDKMLSKRRATAPAGIQIILDNSGNPIPAAPGAEGSQFQRSPPPQASGTSGNSHPYAWHMGPPGEPSGMRANGALQHLAAASMGARSLKFRRTDGGAVPAGPLGLPPMFGGGHIGGMPGSAFGFVPPSSSGSGYGLRMPPLRPHASSGAPSSPDPKPTFAPEESVMRSVSLMDASVAEALAACTKNFAARRCAARDKGYDSSKYAMKKRVSKMLDDGEDKREESQEDMLKSLLAETADNSHAEANLVASLKTFCGKLVRNWIVSQTASVREAFHEGQSMAREDFTKHLYECLN